MSSGEKSQVQTGAIVFFTGFAVAVLSSYVVSGQPAPAEATPQRPTFTNDTATTAPGTVELQFGATGPASGLTLPATIKFTPPTEHRPRPDLVFDIAVEQRGLRAGEFEMLLMGGLTYNIGRIWSR